MKKITNIFQKNWIIIFSILLTIFCIGNAFYNYFNDYYGYSKEYYKYQEICKTNPKNKKCDIFDNIENPKETFKKEETRDLYFKIVYQNLDINIIGPLIIILMTVGILHKDFSSGNIKNYLTRQTLKDYRKKINKTILKVATIFPIILITIFIICMLLTNFNFNILENIKEQSQYDAWNYNNFSLYLFIHCLILYLSAILYGNIGVLFLNRTKNSIIAILMSYITFFIVGIVLYVLMYAIIITNILGLDVPSKLFNILGYWSLYTKYENYILTLLSVIIYTTISMIFVKVIYSNKEKVLINNEK